MQCLQKETETVAILALYYIAFTLNDNQYLDSQDSCFSNIFEK